MADMHMAMTITVTLVTRPATALQRGCLASPMSEHISPPSHNTHPNIGIHPNTKASIDRANPMFAIRLRRVRMSEVSQGRLPAVLSVEGIVGVVSQLSRELYID